MFCQSILKLHQSEVSINSKLCDSIQKHSISHSWQRNTYSENAWDFGLCGGCFSNYNFVRYFSSCSSLISKTASANKVIRCLMKHWEIRLLMSDFHSWSLLNELQLKIWMCNWLSQSSKIIHSTKIVRKREKFHQVWLIKEKWYACRVYECVCFS